MTQETHSGLLKSRFNERKVSLVLALVLTIVGGPMIGLFQKELGLLVTFFGSVAFVMTLREIVVGPVPPPFNYQRRDDE